MVRRSASMSGSSTSMRSSDARDAIHDGVAMIPNSGKSRLAVACLAVLAASTALGQAQRSGNDGARVMQQLQQVTAERTTLQADNDRLQKELDTAKAELTRLQAEQGGLQRRAQSAEAATAKLNSSTAASGETLERTRAQLQELVARFRETTDQLRTAELERSEARNLLGTRERDLKVCIDRNVGLYELNSEMLHHLEDRGFWGRAAEQERITGIVRARLDNLIDDYRYRVEELRVEREQKGALPAPANAASTPAGAR